jgi:TrmH family RNA methyltransferase
MSHQPELGFTNPKVQRLRRLIGRRSSRVEERAFVVEGTRLAAEAVRAGWQLEAQFVAPGEQPIDTPSELYALAPGVAERVSDLETPPGLFAVVTRRLPDPGVLAAADLVVVADRVGEPGNLGTIVRSAEAAGADAVVVTPGTVDETNPKVVRASAGALFHVPVVAATLDDVASAGLRLIGSSSHRGTSHSATDWSGRIAIVAGNESAGLDADTAIDQWVCVEHRGRAESLNVAMATTVLCFEALRQRTAGGPPTPQ